MILYADKCGILGQVYKEFREDENFKHFMSYNDIGVPLAYFVAEGLVKEPTDLGISMIEETFDMFLKLIELSEDEAVLALQSDAEYGDLEKLLEFAYEKKQKV